MHGQALKDCPQIGDDETAAVQNQLISIAAAVYERVQRYLPFSCSPTLLELASCVLYGNAVPEIEPDASPAVNYTLPYTTCFLDRGLIPPQCLRLKH